MRDEEEEKEEELRKLGVMGRADGDGGNGHGGERWMKGRRGSGVMTKVKCLGSDGRRR